MASDLLTVSEFAKRLHVSDSTVRRWIAAREIKAKKIVGSVRIERSELDRLLADDTEPAA